MGGLSPAAREIRPTFLSCTHSPKSVIFSIAIITKVLYNFHSCESFCAFGFFLRLHFLPFPSFFHPLPGEPCSNSNTAVVLFGSLSMKRISMPRMLAGFCKSSTHIARMSFARSISILPVLRSSIARVLAPCSRSATASNLPLRSPLKPHGPRCWASSRPCAYTAYSNSMTACRPHLPTQNIIQANFQGRIPPPQPPPFAKPGLRPLPGTSLAPRSNPSGG